MTVSIQGPAAQSTASSVCLFLLPVHLLKNCLLSYLKTPRNCSAGFKTCCKPFLFELHFHIRMNSYFDVFFRAMRKTVPATRQWCVCWRTGRRLVTCTAVHGFKVWTLLKDFYFLAGNTFTSWMDSLWYVALKFKTEGIWLTLKLKSTAHFKLYILLWALIRRRAAHSIGQAFFPGAHLCNRILAVSYNLYIQ